MSPIVVGAEGAPDERRAQLGASPSLEPFPPMARRSFGAGEHVRVFARVFAGHLADVSTQLRVLRGGQVVSAAPVRLRPASDHGADCGAVIDLAGLAAGSYTIELVASAASKVAASQSVPVEIR